MNHSFSVENATKYGVESAIFIENMQFWLAKNKANNRHFYDGRYWTYNSAKAFSELFPYWSASQVSRIIKKLEDSGILVTGNYNQSAYDRTKWYSLKDEIHLTELKNGNNEVVKTLIRTDINTSINTDTALTRPDDVDEQVWADWLALRKAKRAPVTKTTISGARSQADLAGITLDEFLRVWCRRGSQGLEAAWLKPDERGQKTFKSIGDKPVKLMSPNERKAYEDHVGDEAYMILFGDSPPEKRSEFIDVQAKELAHESS